eukprot:scaffold2911_cov414-Prasinococcus_capsulatus_cf.AAC.11
MSEMHTGDTTRPARTPPRGEWPRRGPRPAVLWSPPGGGAAMMILGAWTAAAAPPAAQAPAGVDAAPPTGPPRRQGTAAPSAGESAAWRSCALTRRSSSSSAAIPSAARVVRASSSCAPTTLRAHLSRRRKGGPLRGALAGPARHDRHSGACCPGRARIIAASAHSLRPERASASRWCLARAPRRPLVPVARRVAGAAS